MDTWVRIWKNLNIYNGGKSASIVNNLLCMMMWSWTIRAYHAIAWQLLSSYLYETYSFYTHTPQRALGQARERRTHRCILMSVFEKGRLWEGSTSKSMLPMQQHLLTWFNVRYTSVCVVWFNNKGESVYLINIDVLYNGVTSSGWEIIYC